MTKRSYQKGLYIIKRYVLNLNINVKFYFLLNNLNNTSYFLISGTVTWHRQLITLSLFIMSTDYVPLYVPTLLYDWSFIWFTEITNIHRCVSLISTCKFSICTIRYRYHVPIITLRPAGLHALGAGISNRSRNIWFYIRCSRML